MKKLFPDFFCCLKKFFHFDFCTLHFVFLQDVSAAFIITNDSAPIKGNDTLSQ